MSGLVSGIVGMRPPAPAQPGVLAYNSATDTNDHTINVVIIIF